jgi:hypothetical protein
MSVENVNQELNQAANEYQVEFLEQPTGNWTSDAMSFETHDEAKSYALDIMNARLSTFADYKIILVVGNQPSF